ncbi:phosphomannomutase [Alteromonas macleodii str. 'Balearic Sea AD45']|uniref:phosphomannomutase/phosphoglucomutase n=1 Tax=Alteromonas macleodii TaxID=28108 RepID=UPI000286F8AB|nr:phosphomannomutase/phosphoglucomutase [Alteromonas macleodii]AFT96890.1 phosphomannomutase [Alteromonas macleodii str. 'Balearic Sea AD45']
MGSQITCFKAYDIRGELNTQLNEEVAYRIGYAFAAELSAKTVVVGSDVRLTSTPLKLALSAGLIDAGAKVTDIGMAGTEEIYFATKHLGVDGGIEVTASHNPINYNGMKLVKAGSVPISGDTGLKAIKVRAEALSDEFVSGRLSHYTSGGVIDTDAFFNGQAHIQPEKLEESEQYLKQSCMDDYVAHMLSYVELDNFTPLKIVVNAGNGSAGPALDAIEHEMRRKNVPIEFIKVHHNADGAFPNGIPNPLLPENRADTADAVKASGADFGIAWDGDFDRCFLFDADGEFIEGYYIVGLLAKAFIEKNNDSKIIYDPRVYWNTEDIVANAGGTPIKSKTGHAFIKERMRKEDAVYGGEMSAHHYFRDFAYCDSGMIPWLLIAELVCVKQQTLASMVKERIKAFPSSGEINSKLKDADAALDRVTKKYQPLANVVDTTDGLGLEFGNWRFNLRKSNTEPVIRLNVESKGNISLMEEKTKEVLALIRAE